MKSNQSFYFGMITLVGLLCVGTLWAEETDHERLAQLKQQYDVKDNQDKRDVVQDLKLNEGQAIGDFVIVGWKYTTEGVDYQFARKGEKELAVEANLRLYSSQKSALEDTLLKYGRGYEVRPSRGHHQGTNDIGDFSLFSARSLAFVRRNVRLFLGARSAGGGDLSVLGQKFSEEIDRRATLWGKKEAEMPSVGVTFERQQQSDGYQVVILLSVPDGMEYTWSVFPSVGKVDLDKTRAIVQVDKGKDTPNIRAIVTTRSGYVFNQSYSH